MTAEPPPIVIGGVGQLYQGDLDLGRLAAERLQAEITAPGVLVEDFHYGAVAVAQRLEDLTPSSLILVGAEAGGEPPGTVSRRLVDRSAIDAAAAREAIEQAGTGYVSIGLVVTVGLALDALPRRTVLYRVEPDRVEPGDRLSEAAAAALEEAVVAVKREVRRIPIYDLAWRVAEHWGGRLLEPSPALDAMRDLVEALAKTEGTGHWGGVFSLRDDVRLRITQGETGEGMNGLDWALWWALIEQLDAVQQAEAAEA